MKLVETRGSSTPSDCGEASSSAFFVSLSFWLTLLCAAVLYAGVALSPRLLAHIELQRRFYESQVRLVQLERQAEQLARVVQALHTEPDFAAELARVDFDAVRPGEEHIPVEPELALDTRTSAAPSPLPAATLPWYAPLVKQPAENHQLRNALLVAAAVLVLFGFTCLHESHADQLRLGAGLIRSGAVAVIRRYRRE